MGVEAIARRYVRAHRALVAADYSALLDARYELDDAFHELCGALGEPCPACDIGECPYSDGYLDDHNITDDWMPPVERVVDVAGLLNEPAP
ncbi:MAG TPA: hypothetical protein VKB59_15315 [Micromonosporaceae bacterium]|nr:hypothetical protein [Micromonosporaceae bacterium]